MKIFNVFTSSCSLVNMPMRILQNRNNTACATLYLDFIYIIELKGFEECIFRGREWRRHIRGEGGEFLNIKDL